MQCTVVSIAPYEILENKPGIIPPSYHLPACKEKSKPSVLVISDAKGTVQLPLQEMTFPFMIAAEDLAEDIVNNLLTAQLEYSLESRPGVFWVHGAHNSEDIPKKFADKLKQADDRQHNWFKKLIQLADNDWARSKMPKAISDIQRMAARSLGVKKEWLDALDTSIHLADCPFCGTKVFPNVAKCHNCKEIINQEKYNELTKKVG